MFITKGENKYSKIFDSIIRTRILDNRLAKSLIPSPKQLFKTQKNKKNDPKVEKTIKKERSNIEVYRENFPENLLAIFGAIKPARIKIIMYPRMEMSMYIGSNNTRPIINRKR